jgi:hypothetical protein
MFLHGKIAVFMGALVERFGRAMGFIFHDSSPKFVEQGFIQARSITRSFDYSPSALAS